VPRLDFGIADNADDCEVVEAAEGVRNLTFAREECFALVTPRLEVIGIGTVLDKSQRPRLAWKGGDGRRLQLSTCRAGIRR